MNRSNIFSFSSIVKRLVVFLCLLLSPEKFALFCPFLAAKSDSLNCFLSLEMVLIACVWEVEALGKYKVLRIVNTLKLNHVPSKVLYGLSPVVYPKRGCTLL